LQWTEGFFRGKGIDTPRLDAELLLAHVLGCPRINLYLQFDRPLGAAELAAFRELVRARAARTPVAYLVGSVGFWKLTLAIRPGVLIPRADTEALVEATLRAISALREQPGSAARPLAVLELGTGSGALPLAVCSEAQHLRWVGVDAAPQAVAVAAENRRRHAHLLAPRGNALLLLRGDRFAALAPSFQPDLIVSNPPYIPSVDIPGLMPEVAQAEPRAALDGGVDGMVFHRYLLDHAAAHLAPGGRLLMEMGQDQGAALTTAAGRRAGLRLLAIHKDLAGRDRVIEVERTE
jgi:release factor glutamine methyltransferase